MSDRPNAFGEHPPFNAGFCYCTGETDKAIFVSFRTDSNSAPEAAREAWIPQSHIHVDSEVWQKGQRGNLIISQWLAEQKGWTSTLEINPRPEVLE